MKKAFITGITGQDGSYLAELLLGKGYQVHGLIRRSSTFNTNRIDHLINHNYLKNSNQAEQFSFHYGDMVDGASLHKLIQKIKPDEVYNLGAQSHVRVSFDMPEYTTNVIAMGTVRLLEVVKELDYPVKFYQASSSEIYGGLTSETQNEQTLIQPQSPYACAKAFSYWMTKNYRTAYGLYAVNGILFNHESPRRGETFVTRKITRALARILNGKQDILKLGNLDAQRDWGHAKDYVEAMWLSLQQDKPDDYVVATGKSYSVRDFLNESFSLVGLNWQDYVEIDPKYFRPNEVPYLCGDPSKAMKVLGWKPKHNFKQLVKIMVESDLRLEQVDLKVIKQA